MRKSKHISVLIDLLRDLRKEPSRSTICFVYSAALTHMFHLAFYDEVESGRVLKHQDFKSKDKIETLKRLIREFPGKEKMFKLWEELEQKRNDLCYGYPDEEDLRQYADRFLAIKEILENISLISFEIEKLELMQDE